MMSLRTRTQTLKVENFNDISVIPRRLEIPIETTGDSALLADLDALSMQIGSIQMGFETEVMSVKELRDELRSRDLGLFPPG
jgi:hypothetical protein